MKLKKASLFRTILPLVTLYAITPSAITDGVNEAKKSEEDIKILQSWSGDFPVAQLDLLPEAQRNSPVGYINDEITFGRVWQAFKPGKAIPEVNFKMNLVLFVRNTHFYNHINIGRVKVENGAAEVLAMETLSALPIDKKVAISIAVIPRKGITVLKVGDQIIPLPAK